jgi:hypothetical protein
MKAPGNWTIEGLFAGRPEAYELFVIVKRYIESLGPVQIGDYPQESNIIAFGGVSWERLF